MSAPRTRSNRRRPVPPKAAQTRVARHRFQPDDTIPLDYQERQTCRTCHVLGTAGDARHLAEGEVLEAYPEQDSAARQLDLRRLGEREDD